MLKTILISELKPGMYVQGVVKQQGSVKVKSEGWVRTQAAINKLAKSGILENLGSDFFSLLSSTFPV